MPVEDPGQDWPHRGAGGSKCLQDELIKGKRIAKHRIRLELNIYFVHWAVLPDKPGFLSSIYAGLPSVTDTIDLALYV